LASIALFWNINGACKVAISSVYNVRRMVSESVSYLGVFPLPSILGDYDDVPGLNAVYDINKYVSRRPPIVYNIRGYITSVRDMIWGIREPVSPSKSSFIYHIRIFAYADLMFSYKIWNGVRKRLVIFWDTRNSVRADVDFAWNISGKLVSTMILIYNTRSALVSVARAKYNIRNFVFAKKTVFYRLHGSLALVALALSYSVRKAVGTTDKYVWKIMKFVSASDVYKWNIRNFAVSARTFVYTIRGNIIRTTKMFLWNTRVRILTSDTYSYSILRGIVARVRARWNIRGWIGSSRVVRYNMRNLLLSTRSVLYNIRSRLVALKRFVYNTRRFVSSSKRVVWSLRTLTASVSSLTYTIRKVVSATTVSALFNINERITTATKSIWNVINKTVGRTRLRYNIFPGRPMDHGTDPYARLREEIYTYLVGKTLPGEEFEGFLIYKRRPTTQAIFFPCIVIDIVGGSEDNQSSTDRYGESCSIIIEVWFKADEVVYLDYF
jgi:hypothetical protein